MFKIADAIIQKPHLRHSSAREIYRQAVKTENNRRKHWRRENAARRSHNLGLDTTNSSGVDGVALDQ